MIDSSNNTSKTGVGMDLAAPAQVTSATDDQELAKVLESMNNTLTTSPVGPVAAPDEPADTNLADDGLQFMTASAPLEMPAPVPAAMPVTPAAPVAAPVAPVASMVDNELESIKKDALTELRPLVDKLNLSPEDKFDTLLLIIRSTDDKSLVSQAHMAAKMIEDESRRAEALLDVIKEIDYFSHPAS